MSDIWGAGHFWRHYVGCLDEALWVFRGADLTNLKHLHLSPLGASETQWWRQRA